MKIDIPCSGTYWIDEGQSKPVQATVVGFSGVVNKQGVHISYKVEITRKIDCKIETSYRKCRKNDLFKNKLDAVKSCLGVSGDFDEALI